MGALRPSKKRCHPRSEESLLLLVFRRRQRFHRQRMKAGVEFVLEGGIDQALAGDAGLSVESLRHDFHPEMRLAGLAPAGVTVMLRGFVFDGQAYRRERRPELAVNRRRHLAHDHLASSCRFCWLNTY